MKTAERCVVCGGEIVFRKTGVVAPFLARRIWNGKAPAIQLVECRNCSFLFFNPRLEPEEEQRLYTGYRLEEYQELRQSCEPWYTRGFNAKLPALSMSRQGKLSQVLRPFVAGIEKPSILDFGGDHGQLLQGLIPNSVGFVYDISGVELVNGVGRCRDLRECRERKFDLIICSNVLEHVGFPRIIMEQIREIATPETMVFIEVPFESPFGSTLAVRRLAQLGILALMRPGIALSMARPGFHYLMHEHINYYNRKALEALMTTSGGTVMASDSYPIGSGIDKGVLGWCMGRMAGDRAGILRVAEPQMDANQGTY